MAPSGERLEESDSKLRLQIVASDGSLCKRNNFTLGLSGNGKFSILPPLTQLYPRFARLICTNGLRVLLDFGSVVQAWLELHALIQSARPIPRPISWEEITYFHTQSLGQKHDLCVVYRGPTILDVGNNIACHVAPK
jgi:hypothetical protein